MKAFYTTAAVSLFVCGVGLAEPQRGLIADFPIDTKLFPATKEYYKSKVPRKVFKAYDDGNVPASWKEAKTPVDECKDFNYKAILETSKEWDNAGFMYKFFDHKGMGHANASGPALEEALIWIGADELSESAGNSEAVTPKSFGLRTWSAVNGKTIDATLVEDKGVRVVLKTEAGQELSIYTAQLSAADRKYLADLKQ